MKLDIQNYPEYVVVYIDDHPILINNNELEYFLARVSNRNNYTCLRSTP